MAEYCSAVHTGVGIIEFQAITNYPQKGKGRQICPHLHMIAWPNGANYIKFADDTVQARFTSAHGSATVDIEQIVDTEVDLARVICYAMKSPHSGKVLNKKKNGNYYLTDTTEDYRPELCVRVAEITSRFNIDDLVFSCGEGKHLRRAAFSKLTRWERAPLSRLGDTFDTEPLWARIRATNGSKLFQPPIIIK